MIKSNIMWLNGAIAFLFTIQTGLLTAPSTSPNVKIASGIVLLITTLLTIYKQKASVAIKNNATIPSYFALGIVIIGAILDFLNYLPLLPENSALWRWILNLLIAGFAAASKAMFPTGEENPSGKSSIPPSILLLLLLPFLSGCSGVFGGGLWIVPTLTGTAAAIFLFRGIKLKYKNEFTFAIVLAIITAFITFYIMNTK